MNFSPTFCLSVGFVGNVGATPNINESKGEFVAIYVDAKTGEIVGGERSN